LMYFASSDIAYVATVYTLSLFGFTANCFLLLLIIYRSPKNLSSYRIFLANTTITHLLSDVVTILCLRALRTNLRINLRLCLMRASITCSTLFSVHLTLNSSISWMISMIYRGLVLQHFKIGTKVAVLFCIAGYVVPLSMLVRLTSHQKYLINVLCESLLMI
uniref:G_PROTEIN_RECEP_F1_2 domain-containing protein n=1 Tax=Angiostrongylus cantonensis TaxID=6313 RepID=A0A0K0DPN7_ANGCA